jgi:tetratricopeptide (TPR) repeat protein
MENKQTFIRIKTLSEAKNMAFLEKDYDSSISILDEWLNSNKDDVDALRLKGNILDLKALDLMQDGIEDISLFELARNCYEKILIIKPNSPLAYVDLAEYWLRNGCAKEALTLCNKSIELLENGYSSVCMNDEIEEAYNCKIDILNKLARTKEALSVAAKLQAKSEIKKPIGNPTKQSRS